MLTDLTYRLRALFRRQRMDDELHEELQHHLEREAEKYRSRGISPVAAIRQARLAIGGPEQVRQHCRDTRGTRFLEDLLQDLRFAVRQLQKSPGFTFTTLAVFALGIGASTAIYAFVNAALVQPLPYRDPSRLVALYEHIPVGERYHLSEFDYYAWKERNRVFTSLDVYRPDRFTLSEAVGAEEVSGAIISAAFFRTLGVAPFLGRDFRSGEDQPSTAQTVMLSYEAWQKRFGSNKNAIGSAVVLDGQPFLIIGVLPPWFHFAPVGRAEFWRPLHQLCSDNHSCFPYYGVARLNKGVSVEAAFENMSSIARQIATEYPQHNRDRSATVIPLSDAILGDIRPTLLALLSGAGLLCLIGFVNVSSLLLVRSETRRREIAVRGALGASRMRLIRQFTVEGFLLAAAGCILGMALTVCSIKFLANQIPENLLENMPYLQGVRWNTNLALFAISVSILGGLLFSAGPALYLFFSDMQKGLVEGGRTSAGRGWRRLGAGLVAVELAITVVLLVSAGLLAKSFYVLLHLDIGISSEHLALLHVSKPVSNTSVDENEDVREIELEQKVLARMKSLPGVTSVGVSRELPFGSGEGFSHLFAHFRAVGRPYVGLGEEAIDQTISVGYLEALQARLLKGRYFAETDNDSRPRVAVINRTMATLNFPGEDPIGKRIINEYDPEHPIEIVGVVDDLKDGPLDMPPTSAIYSPFNQLPTYNFYVTVRATQSEKTLLSSMVVAAHQIDPELIVDRQESMADRINNSQSAYLHRSAAWIAAGFSAIALSLGIVGLYGVVSYSVGQRTREIGVRMALGAQRSSVYQLILIEASWLAAVGIAGGIISSLGVAGFLRGMLFGVSPWDVPTLASVTIMLVAAALLASFIPARRAASINPTEALRAD